VDPLADAPLNVGTSPYTYVWNNPLKFVDPDGRHGETTIVGDNGDGTYTVQQVIQDGKTDIVTTAGQKIGNSLTTHSFADDQGNAVVGAIIDPSDKSGQKFFDNDLNRGETWMWEYMPNATGGKDYDFKTNNMPSRLTRQAREQYTYRGMPFEGKIASARDIGNFGAGAVAASNSLNWSGARTGFDGLQKWQDKSMFSVEGKPTQLAQRAGFDFAYPRYIDRQVDRIIQQPLLGTYPKY
jgi:hypothetical protein